VSFTQIIINVDSESAERLSDIFFDLEALSVSVTDQFEGTDLEQPIFNEPGIEASGVWEKSRLLILYPKDTDVKDIIKQAEESFGNQISYLIETVDEQDWVKLTQNQFEPIKICDGFYITPSWHEPPSGSDISITLDPGLAFGTGSHPTTFMCLQWIANNLDSSTKSLLDYGCGSGILAIAGKKFGAKDVYGVDIDPQAITSSMDNAKANLVDIKFSLPDVLKESSFDIVIANILSNPLRFLAPALANYTKDKLILSGILESQAEELAKIYSQWFNVKIANTMDGWVLLECIKKPC